MKDSFVSNKIGRFISTATVLRVGGEKREQVFYVFTFFFLVSAKFGWRQSSIDDFFLHFVLPADNRVGFRFFFLIVFFFKIFSEYRRRV